MEIDEELIIKYLQGECSETELRRLNAWLAESDENSKELFSLEILYQSRDLARYSSPEFLKKQKEKLDRRLEREERPVRKIPSARRRFLRYTSAAAALLLMILAGRYVHDRLHPLQVLKADRGQVEETTLADGTRVWLNQGATLKYPAEFDGEQREVFLEGEGFFEVAKNAECPFVVQTESMEVTVLGTAFNLNSTAAADKASVTLFEGEVKVRGKDDEGLVTLSPGQKAKLYKSSKKMLVCDSKNTLLDGVWHDGLIPFSQASLKDIAHALETIYDVQVNLGDKLPMTTYSGVLRSEDSVSMVLSTLSNTIPIAYEIDGDDVYIKAK